MLDPFPLDSFPNMDDFKQLKQLYWGMLIQALLVGAVGLITWVISKGFENGTWRFQSILFVKVSVESPDELFFWLNRYILSMQQMHFEKKKQQQQPTTSKYANLAPHY
jgi:hypothetical protein